MSLLDYMRLQPEEQVPQKSQLQVKGEIPYGVTKENILSRIQRTLGNDRIAGILGALTMPEGRIDETGQRVGPSPFQAGLLGYQQGRQGYLDRQAAQAKEQEEALLRQREVGAKEEQARAATTRAGHYGTWVSRPRGGTTRQTLQDRVREWMQMSPEEQRAAIEAGFAGPRRGSSAEKRTNQENQVRALLSEFEGMTEDEARIIVTNKPSILSTGTEYDLGAFKKDKKVTLRNTREYGVSRQVKRILARHNLRPEDVYGFISALDPSFPSGPQNPADVSNLSGEEINQILDSLPPGGLDDEQLDWIQNRLDELEQEEAYGESGEGEEEPLAPIAPQRSHQRSY